MEKKLNKVILLLKKWLTVIKVVVVRFATLYDPTGWSPFAITLIFEIILTVLQKDEPNQTDKTA